jgi:hypothetical protein
MMSPSLSDFQRLSAELEGVLHFDATKPRVEPAQSRTGPAREHTRRRQTGGRD